MWLSSAAAPLARSSDASIIPEVPSSTTNVTVIMLAGRIFQRAYA